MTKEKLKEMVYRVLMLLALPFMFLLIFKMHAMIWCEIGSNQACSHSKLTQQSLDGGNKE